MESMGMKKRIKQTRAADIRNKGDLVSRQFHVAKSFVQSGNDPLMGTTRAK
jgi:hypothetical protein